MVRLPQILGDNDMVRSISEQLDIACRALGMIRSSNVLQDATDVPVAVFIWRPANETPLKHSAAL